MIRITGCATRVRKALQLAAFLVGAVALSALGTPAAGQARDPSYCDRSPRPLGGERESLAPPLIELPLSRAEAVLRGHQLTPRRIEVRSPQPADRVVNQWPKPGQPVPERIVWLCVSNGQGIARVPMPHVEGQTLGEALGTLAAAEITNTPETPSAVNDARPGTVFHQSPEPQTLVTAGTPIILHVSKGPAPPQMVEVPRLIGLTEVVATERLAAAGLNPEQRSRRPSDLPAGQVDGSDPPAGAQVRLGSPVAYWLSLGPGGDDSELVEVPSVEGLGKGGTIARLEQIGLRPVEDGPEESLSPAGQVTRTDPPAGARVPRGTAVRYFLSLGPQPERDLLTRLLDGDPLPLALLLAVLAVAVAVKFVLPQRPKLEVRWDGPPQGRVDWGDPPAFALDVEVEPPTAKAWRGEAGAPGEKEG